MFVDGHLHFRDMPQRITVLNDVQNFAFLANEETNAARKVALGHSHAVGIGGLALGIGKQGVGELEFFRKPLMAGDGITTDTHDFHSLLDERTDVVTVSAGLLGTAGSIVLRVKIQQHCVHRGPGKGVGEIPRFVGLILRGDNGSRGADF